MSSSNLVARGGGIIRNSRWTPSWAHWRYSIHVQLCHL
jgi:hypothetical protein